MNIKEISKELTRKEFMHNLNSNYNHRFIYKNFINECPSDLELKNYCENNTCKNCWLEAIKNIKFKGENDMNKREELETLVKEKREEIIKLNEEILNMIQIIMVGM